MSGFLRQAGKFVVWLFHYVAAYLSLWFDAVRAAPAIFRNPGRRVFLKQVYFTGIEALPLVTAIALGGGFVAIQQLDAVLSGDMDLTITVFRTLVVREGAVLFVAFMVLARSGSAIASELADTRQHGEVASLYRLGIDPAAYLVAPRVAACAVSTACLALYCQTALVFGGFALVSIFMGWDYGLAVQKFTGGVSDWRTIVALAQSVVLGAIIGTVCCQQGLNVAPGPLGIPVATRTSMVHSMTGIILAYAFFLVLFS